MNSPVTIGARIRLSEESGTGVIYNTGILSCCFGNMLHCMGRLCTSLKCDFPDSLELQSPCRERWLDSRRVWSVVLQQV